MRIQIRTPSRAGLAGNPSDAYGGRAVAVAVAGIEAQVTLEPSIGVRISSPRAPILDLDSPRLLADPRLLAPDSPHRLAVATYRQFVAWAGAEESERDAPGSAGGFDLAYRSDIPRHVGLAGSSALAIGILRALSLRYGIPIPELDLPGLALAVETDWLRIHGGLMDRVSQTLGGVTYMDLSVERVRESGRGSYERLPEDRLPPLFVAWDSALGGGSDTVHNALKDRLALGDPEAEAILRELASLADEARCVLLSGAPVELAGIMDRNFDLRARLMDVGEGNRRLVETGRGLGAGVKQTGSGGAVVGAHDGDPDRVNRLRAAYARIGASFLQPAVWTAPTGAPTGSGRETREPSESRDGGSGGIGDA